MKFNWKTSSTDEFLAHLSKLNSEDIEKELQFLEITPVRHNKGVLFSFVVSLIRKVQSLLIDFFSILGSFIEVLFEEMLVFLLILLGFTLFMVTVDWELINEQASAREWVIATTTPEYRIVLEEPTYCFEDSFERYFCHAQILQVSSEKQRDVQIYSDPLLHGDEEWAFYGYKTAESIFDPSSVKPSRIYK